MADREQMVAREWALADFGDLSLRSDSPNEVSQEACRIVAEAPGTDLGKDLEIQPDKQELLVKAGVGSASHRSGRSIRAREVLKTRLEGWGSAGDIPGTRSPDDFRGPIMTAVTEDFRDIRHDYHEQVGMLEAVRRAFSNYANFQGRANRGEYWWFALAALIVNVATQALDWTILGAMNGGFPIFSIVWALLSFLPSLSLAVRRLHDIGRSGWSFLVILIPLVGLFILIKRMATKGEASPNRFG